MGSAGRAAAAIRLFVLAFLAGLLQTKVGRAPAWNCGCGFARPLRSPLLLEGPRQPARQVGAHARRPKDNVAGESLKGGIGGAVLGGLLLGPFGAVFGAQLGADFGRQRAQDAAAVEEMGLDEEMVQLAQRVASDLVAATQDRDRVESTRADLTARVQQLEAEADAKYAEAMEALKADNDDLARQALGAKQAVQARLVTLKAELRKAEGRCATMDKNVERLEQRAMQVSELLKRASTASASERTALAAEASGLTISPPRDPLLDRFDALERGGR
mmetsp:Transcript_21568/g.64815  ORF Transcript_21568/g.64815 Transcript_21568/m.64815 type:complete len:274 (+) Transcript_21568:48-869(+)